MRLEVTRYSMVCRFLSKSLFVAWWKRTATTNTNVDCWGWQSYLPRLAQNTYELKAVKWLPDCPVPTLARALLHPTKSYLSTTNVQSLVT